MSRLTFVLLLLIGFTSLTVAACGASSQDAPDGVADADRLERAPASAGPDHRHEVAFASHLQAGMNEQDVYLLQDGEAVRMTPAQMEDEALLGQVVYKTADATAHDPLNLSKSPTGPFAAGEALDFTMEDWLAARGEGAYEVVDGRGTMSLDFTGLVPGGLYTMWCSEMHMQPGPRILDYPCGAPDGSESAFTADESGEASFRLEADALPASSEEVIQILAVAYHSDGQEHGALPGDFGSRTHVQLMHMLPAPGAALSSTK